MTRPAGSDPCGAVGASGTLRPTTDQPGLGFDDLNEDVLKAHVNPKLPDYFEPTEQWNTEFSNDRIWS